MKGIARIAFGNGGFLVPAETPYDRQLLFEHVAQCARVHGQIRLSLDGGEWTVARADSQSRVCSVCDQQPDRLAYAKGQQTLCHPCACRTLR